MKNKNNAGKTTYKDSGVDIEIGDKCSKMMYAASQKTWANRKGKIGEVVAAFDDFSGLRYVDISGLKDAGMSMNFDGVGTKVEIAERLSSSTGNFSYHKGIAFDLFAMVCDDAVVRGAEPVIIGSILDVSRLNAKVVKNLADGMVEAAKEAGVAVVNGEIAELGERVGGFGDFNYNWGATVLWVAEKKKLISGHEVRPGDKVIAFKEKGFRSNGLSLFRKIMKDAYGNNWHEKEKRLAELALAPSKIYCSAVVDMLGGYGNSPRAKLKAVAHITGGGIPGKLGRALKPSGFGADISNPFDPPEIMLKCQKLGNVDDREAYRAWNMGNGMMVVTDEPDKVIKIAKEHKIDAKVAGEITERKGIRIRNRGEYSEREKELEF